MSRSSFVERHGLWSAAQQAATDALERRLHEDKLELVRFAWPDLHGVLRGKTLTADAAVGALRNGVKMVGTLLLKDSSHRTAYPVFQPGASASALAGAADVVMVPDPTTFQVLPWAESTGWVQCMAYLPDGRPAPLDPRHAALALQRQLAQLGMGLTTGLEVEFHIYRITGVPADPAQASWPPAPPEVALLHPGFNHLTEQWFDMAEPALRIVQRTAQALGLPLLSLEVELGPSQVEAVFGPCDALQSADQMVLFRSATKQALRRAGYHATFMCRPPFDNVISSGWHLHQSLRSLEDGRNLFAVPTPATAAAKATAKATATPSSSSKPLSDLGMHWLGGLLHHAHANAALACPTSNGYARYRGSTMAPQLAVWGHDNRGALLRVVDTDGPAARVENRAGEPLANPYLYVASQLAAGLDGLQHQRDPGPATENPYQPGSRLLLPQTLEDALAALSQSDLLRQPWGQGLGAELADHVVHVKHAELARRDAQAGGSAGASAGASAGNPGQSKDHRAWEHAEYFGVF